MRSFKQSLLRYLNFSALILCSFGLAINAQAQVNHPTAGTVNETVTCGTPINYFDSGGAGGGYTSNELGTIVFCPDVPGQAITLAFSSVDIETSPIGAGSFPSTGCCWDGLAISDMNGTLFAGCGEDSGDGGDACSNSDAENGPNDLEPGDSFTSTAADGCITITFDSDGSVTESGWEATVSCNAIMPPTNCTSLYDQPSDAPAIVNGYSIFGAPERSVMDDFVVPAGSGWIIEEVSLIFTRDASPFIMPDIEIQFRGDVFGAPGAVLTTEVVPAGNIVDNGMVSNAFLREWHAVTVPLAVPALLPANGTYWLEIGTPSADNYFLEAININAPIGSESWVDYADGNGLEPASNLFVFPVDHSFNLCGSLANPPNAVCSNATVVLSATNPGMATLTVADIDGGSTNDAATCGPLNLSIVGQTAFTCADIGPGNQVTVTLQAMDNCGTSTCDAIITTVDQTPPTPVCQGFAAQLDANGVATVALSDVLASASDNCGVVPGGQISQDAFNCAELGTNMVTVTVTDVNGLSGNCTAVVDVADAIAPIEVCQDITVQLDASGNAVIAGAELDGGSSDNCGPITFMAIPNTFNCANVGANVVLLVVTDATGNLGTCNSTVTVEDNIAPVAVCQNISVDLDANGEVSIMAVDVNGSSSDACTIVSLTVNQTEFDCDNLGLNTVILTVTDANGNSASCSATVTVNDIIPAAILCRSDVNTVNDMGLCGADVLLLPPLVISENCSITNITNDAPALFPTGTTEVIWTLTDAGGNNSQCTQNVTINDTEDPVIDCGNSFIAYTSWENCGYPSYLLEGATATDNCPGVVITDDAPTFFPPGQYMVNYTATDAVGNTAVCMQWVKIYDTTKPKLTSCPENIEVEATTADGGNASWTLPTGMDNCPGPIILVEENGFAPGDLFPIGETEISYRLYDQNGQFVECEFTVTVIAAGDPLMTLTCMPDLGISLSNAANIGSIGWNPPLMNTGCDQCDILASDDFEFIGTLAGHQYYTYTANEITFAEAIAYAENIGATIAILEDKKEVPMIENELPEGNYFIGLIDEEGTGEFQWINDEEFKVASFGTVLENETDKPSAVILNEEGEWEVVILEDATANFVFEKACIEWEMGTEINDEEINTDDEELDLVDAGEIAEITYTAVDQCGNVASCGFEVAFVAEAVAYCEPTGIATDEENPYFIESFSLNGYTVETGDDEGYGDHTDEHFLFEGGETLDMYTVFDGPNIDELPMYCRIWLDLNNDGDFFDEGELLMQGVDIAEAIEELTIPNVTQTVENTVMRIAISRLTYAESCGDFLNGEVEDYTVSIVKPEEVTENSQVGINGSGVTTSNRLGANMLVYPNPAQDELFVKLNNMESETATLRMYNSVGQLVATQKVATIGAVRLDVSTYTSGLYSVTAEADGEVQLTQKFMVERR
jgi:hypothetical protein